MTERVLTETDRVLARRAAVATICEAAARGVIERVVDEAVSAASRFGLSRERATQYVEGIEGTLPLALEALRMPDGPERSSRTTGLARAVREVSQSHHIPRIVERGLIAIAVRITREVVRRRAAELGFTPDNLERELVIFTDRFMDQLFAG